MSERRIGRAAFLSVVGPAAVGLLAGTGSRALFSRPLGVAGSVVPQGLKDILPIGGWRIYAINPPWPEFHPAQYRLEVTGHVRNPAHAFVGRPDGPARRPGRRPTSTA